MKRWEIDLTVIEHTAEGDKVRWAVNRMQVTADEIRLLMLQDGEPKAILAKIS